MIQDFDGDRMTLKQAAQVLFLDAASRALYAVYDGYAGDDWTEREKAQVIDQFHKQFRRVEKLFGYEPGSWSID